MDKEAILLIEKYLEGVKKSIKHLSKEERKDYINTIKSHLYDALEDQKGILSEIEIIKNTIKDLGPSEKIHYMRERFIEFSVFTFIQIVFLIGVLFSFIPPLTISSYISEFLKILSIFLAIFLVINILLSSLQLAINRRSSIYKKIHYLQIILMAINIVLFASIAILIKVIK
ncbi:MAG: hypothetical protein JXA99_10060 [Candidatus Lokiarchaeota archaeon]|nr:hypothetical protein [Candidatus Lokiarchaeota archaeon]